MDDENTNLLRTRSPSELRPPIFHLFWGAFGTAIRGFAIRIFRFDGSYAQLALLGSDRFVLRVATIHPTRPHLELGVLAPQVRDLLVKQYNHFLCNFRVELVLSNLVHGYRRKMEEVITVGASPTS